MVEQEAVNFEVAGSSPAPGAMRNGDARQGYFLFLMGFCKAELGPVIAKTLGCVFKFRLNDLSCLQMAEIRV